ncbi:hypothetical protein D0Z00_002125 [Geotrichum galactomycetum]|uniref:Uncharacterized protein n=1 Tax=Geotrichum galactomycetum TaxID=27317 RepID=A0ACB6V4X5_9ASCO|nr:hypothetical protein D0Z00_002125 [Geotrichum candidum]
MPQTATPASETPSSPAPTSEADFNLNDLFKNFPEEFLQNLSNVLGKQNEFINTVGDYIVNKTTPVLTTLAEQLIAEVQKQVVTKGSELHDKINNELPEALDAIISEFKSSTKDFSQLKLLRKFLEKLEALKKVKVETNSNGTSVSLDDVHEVLRQSVQESFTLSTFEDDIMVNACPSSTGMHPPNVPNLKRDVPVSETNSVPDLVSSGSVASPVDQASSVTEEDSQILGPLVTLADSYIVASPIPVSPAPEMLSSQPILSTPLHSETSGQHQPLSTEDVEALSQSEKTTIYAITVVNTTNSNWATGARLVSKKYGESSKIIFEIAPTQSYTFVLPVHTGVTVKELSADSWFVKSESFEISLEVKVPSIEGADQSQEQEPLTKSLSSSEVVLPKLPVESLVSSSIASSNSNLQSSKSDFTSSMMDMFMSIPNETSSGEKTVNESSESDSDASLMIVSRTASPSIMAASLSGVDTDYEDDHIIDEDDMFTESEYAFV